MVRTGQTLTVFAAGRTHRLELKEFEAVSDEEVGGSLAAPMPGSVVDVLVASGERVEKGQPLMILEAMKMEHTIVAPAAGVVAQVCFARGDQVKEGEQLLTIREGSQRMTLPKRVKMVEVGPRDGLAERARCRARPK